MTTAFKMLKTHVTLVIFTSFITLLFYTQGTAANDTNFQPKREHSSQCVKIIRALERYHYLEKELDNEMSQTIFHRYIKRLDPGKRIFTSHYIERLSIKKTRLDNELKRGNLNTAFNIFNLYMDQSKLRLAFLISLIEQWENEFEFNVDESIIIDNDKRRWQPDTITLRALWKKELKNHIITLLLDEEKKESVKQTLNKIYSGRLKRLKQTNSDDIFQIFMNSVTASFDPHTQFYPPRVSEDFDMEMSKSFQGIGAVLQIEDDYTKVVRLIPKGPADKSNQLMPGDKIIGVGQGEKGDIKDTIGQRIDHVVNLIRGPKNTIVRLKIIPAKKVNSTKTIRIKRDRVKLEEQAAKKKVVTLTHNDQNLKLGIIEIPNFYIDFNAYNKGDKNYKSTTRDVKKFLVELKKEKIDGLIIDLRDNGGGSLKEADDLTGLFLKSGPTVQIKTKYRISRLYDDDNKIEYSGPLIVLINRMSASASEIFAGAIKDYNRGVIVGSRSFGKGTVQELQPLGGGKLKLTSAKFYRVSGESTQHLGIVPDLKYPQIYKVEETGESSLDGALKWDKTIRSKYNSYSDLYTILEKLTKKYNLRAKNNPGFTYINKRLEMASQINNQTNLSLDLNTRKEKKKEIEEIELHVENEYLQTIGEPLIQELDHEETKIKDFKTILMEETHLVMADFINFSNDFGYAW